VEAWEGLGIGLSVGLSSGSLSASLSGSVSASILGSVSASVPSESRRAGDGVGPFRRGHAYESKLRRRHRFAARAIREASRARPGTRTPREQLLSRAVRSTDTESLLRGAPALREWVKRWRLPPTRDLDLQGAKRRRGDEESEEVCARG
jgi:hypothetical protein